MATDDDFVPLDSSDPRRERKYLAPHIFLSGGDAPDPAPDPLDGERWGSLMNLPTDVALRTSAGSGSACRALIDMTHDWVFATPMDPGQCEFAFDSRLVVGEELDACTFNAIHGYYRPAVGCLRTAFERMTVGTSLVVADDRVRYESWRSGRDIPVSSGGKFLPAAERLSGMSREKRTHLVGNGQNTWPSRLYRDLSRFTQGLPGATSGELWSSNGPVYVGEALNAVLAMTRELVLHLHLLLSIAWDAYKPTTVVLDLINNPDHAFQAEAALVGQVLQARSYPPPASAGGGGVGGRPDA